MNTVYDPSLKVAPIRTYDFEIKDDEVVLKINDVNLVVSRKKFENCQSRCIRHRLEASQQAREVYGNLFFLKGFRSDARTEGEGCRRESLQNVLQDKKVCIHCLCVYLLLLQDVRGEGIAEIYLQWHKPLYR